MGTGTRISGATLGLVALACLVGPLLLAAGPDTVNLRAIHLPPSPNHPLGTDDLGRDILVRILHGGRYSLLIGVAAALLSTGLGVLVGGAAGLAGGRVDGLLMRLTDVVLAVPALPLLIVLASFVSPGPVALALVIGLLSWMSTARVVRGELLRLREADFVQAARAMGASPARILGRHLLPNAAGPLVVSATLAVGNAILAESAVSFLGLGVPPSTPTWGNMLMDAQASMATAPWLTVFPGMAILVVVLAVNFLGDEIQEAMDPRGGPDSRPRGRPRVDGPPRVGSGGGAGVGS